MLRSLDWTHVLILVVAAVAVVYAVGDAAPATSDQGSDKQVATIQLTGTIQAGSQLSADGTTPKAFRELVEEAQQDDVAGFLFEINSGGGSVVASKDIARVIEDIDDPTVCLMKDAAASGAYWAATACDEIVADSLSVTGSIGVTSTYMEFSGLLERLNIDYVNLTAGELKDIGSPLKNLTERERAVLQQQLDVVHTAFIDQVADKRNMSREEVRQYATGEPLLGKQAHKAGLIDQLGSRKDAIQYLENRTEGNVTAVAYHRKRSFGVLSMLTAHLGEGIGKGISTVFSVPRIDDAIRLQ